jgi:signal transduction histidine kinase
MQNPDADPYFIEILFLILPSVIIAIGLYIALFIYVRRYLSMFKRFKIQQLIQIENERKRIANDLHDFVAGKLVMLKSEINEIIQQVEDVTVVKKLHHTLEDVNHFHEGIRSVVEYIYPRELLANDVLGSFKSLAMEMSNAESKVIFETELTLELQNWQLHQVFRITQEKIANIISHARPKNLVISIHDGEKVNECELTFSYYLENDIEGNDNVNKIKKYKGGRGMYVIDDRLKVLNAKYKFTRFDRLNHESIIFGIK